MSEQQPATTNYEFDATQNTTIRALASAMKFVAIIEILVGIVYGVVAVFGFLAGNLWGAIGNALVSVFSIILAAMLSNASGYFHSVVNSQGSDVQHLMAALEHLRSYFNLKRILYIIMLALFAIGIVFVFLFAARSEVSTSGSDPCNGRCTSQMKCVDEMCVIR